MGTAEQLTAHFYDWEKSGRGWQSYPFPVALEPPFHAFEYPRPVYSLDDGRQHTWLSRLLDRLATDSDVEPSDPVPTNGAAEPQPDDAVDSWCELEILVPSDAKIDLAAMAGCLASLTTCRNRLAFEVIGASGMVTIQLVCSATDRELVRAQLASYFPQVTARPTHQSLGARWTGAPAMNIAAIEFGLAREFMLPLKVARGGPDTLTPLIGALAQLHRHDLALLQVVFEEVRQPWAESIRRSVHTPNGNPFFADAPEITALTKEKTAERLYAVVLRIAAKTDEETAAWEIVRGLAGGLTQFGSPQLNELVPLAADEETLIHDVLTRKTHRSGMIWSAAEVVSLVHLPGENLRQSALLREDIPLRIPAELSGEEGIQLGEARQGEKTISVRLPTAARLKHVHVIGASGTGKSTLLVNMILQDIAAGQGVGVIDPHGDLADEVLSRIPDAHRNDMIYLDPTAEEYVFGYNILQAHSPTEQEILGSDLVALFRRLSTSWGDQMTVVLANSILAFLESPQGGTLLELRRFLVESDYREAFLKTVADPQVVSFWKREFPLLIGRKPQGPILTRLDTFLRSRMVREVVTEREKPLDFREIVDTGKIFIARLSQGAIGEENAALLGGLLVSKFHQVSMGRQGQAAAERRPFFLYIDEFQQVATPSMAGLFAGVRKYSLGLVVAHQNLYQLHDAVPGVERSVLANAYTRLCFRVGDEDARTLERGFANFQADDLLNLETGEAIGRVGRKSDDFRLQTRRLPAIPEAELEERRESIKRQSGERYGRKRTAVSPIDQTVAVEASMPIAASAPPPVSIVPEKVVPSLAPSAAPSRKISRGRVVEQTPLGRGGPEHQYLQELIRQWGQARGYRVTIEHQLANGGQVDVLLEREELAIACEVAVTSTVEQEVGNVRKSLGEPFQHLVVVSLKKAFLTQLEAALGNQLSATERDRVKLLAPEELLSFLDEQATDSTKQKVAGYNVRVRYRPGTPAEAQTSKRAVTDIIARSLRRLKAKP